MAAVKELIKVREDGRLCFGDYTLKQKTKLDGFEYQGDIYKVKTFSEITKLEKNGMFVYESVPGTAVEGLTVDEDSIEFNVSGAEDAQFTLELEPETEYTVYMDASSAGKMKTNLGGKLSVSAELNEGTAVNVKIVRE